MAKFMDTFNLRNKIGYFIRFCRDDFKIDMNSILQQSFSEQYIKDEELLWHDGQNFIYKLDDMSNFCFPSDLNIG